MKKISLLLIALVLICGLAFSLPSLAETVKPGDTISITVNYNATKPLTGAQVNYTFSSGLAFVDGSSNPPAFSVGPIAAAGGFFVPHLGPGTVTINFKVKDNASGDQYVDITSVEGSGDGWSSAIGTPKKYNYTVESDEVWGEWKIDKEPTCTEAGERSRESDKGNKETEKIDPIGHDWDAGKIIKDPTCTEKGQKEFTCKNDPTHKKVEEVPALGHDYEPGKIIKAATCLEEGQQEFVCKHDPDHTEIRPIKPTGHDWGEWEAVKAATCTEKGMEERVCKNDPTHKETREIPMLAHKKGEWVVTIQPDPAKKLDGERVKYCTVGGEILETEVIPYSTTTYFPNNTASTQGLRFRDLKPELGRKWFMFTPLDLSADGEQVIPIIASNAYFVGKAMVNVADGAVTVTYEFPKAVKVKSEFLTLFADLDSVTAVDPAALAEQAYTFGEPINIEEALAGDTKVLLYTNFVIDYNDSIQGVTRFFTGNKGYQAAIAAMKELMD